MLRHPRFRRQTGFTLIELMIVVAIIGILAALAIPNFVRLQLRTKSAEGRLNLAGIRKAEDGYFAEVGVFLAWSSNPQTAGSPPGASKTAWGVVCSSPPSSASPGFCIIGWEPEGDVYFNYAVETNGGSVGLNAAQFFAAAEADLDNDGRLNLWGLKKADNAGAAMSTGPFGCTDVLGVSGNAALGQIGPCDEVTNGINIF